MNFILKVQKYHLFFQMLLFSTWFYIINKMIFLEFHKTL